MALKEAEARQKRILDADYSAVDLSYYAHTETHLSTEHNKRNLYVLYKNIISCSEVACKRKTTVLALTMLRKLM